MRAQLVCNAGDQAPSPDHRIGASDDTPVGCLEDSLILPALAQISRRTSQLDVSQPAIRRGYSARWQRFR